MTMVTNAIIEAQLRETLEGTNFPDLGDKYTGKVRDCYTRDGKRTIVVTDRISAFDVVLGTIPFKGQVLNQIANHWFKETAHLAPNHVIEVPDPTVTLATECTLLPVEFVYRAYMTGVTTTRISSGAAVTTAISRAERPAQSSHTGRYGSCVPATTKMAA